MLAGIAAGRRARHGMRGFTVCLGAALLLIALIPPGAPAPPEPRGMVEEPRLQTFSVSPAQDTRFEFKGWVDFPGSRGRIRIDVLNNGNGDANDALSWEIEVATAIPADIPTVAGEEERFEWSVGPVAIFEPSASGQDRWPEGGTARVRFVAIRQDPDGSESQALLPAHDANGVESWIPELIVADRDPRPTTQAPASAPNYLNKKPPLRSDQTSSYYASVGTLQDGRGSSISQSLPTLSKFQARYVQTRFLAGFRRVERVIARARYYNRGDLGIGRDMTCAFTPSTQETACYVRNYGRRDGTPLFGDVAESFEAMKADQPFATVAMVERGLMPRGAPNKVFFVVYDNTGRLAREAPLDTKGFNKFVPGNCLVCHGSGGSYKPTCFFDDFNCRGPFDAEVQGGFFLPFDLSSFRFSSQNPEDPLSREAQEPAFKRLNEIVGGTDLRHLPHALELLDGWYGGPGRPGETFDEGFVPEGWNQNESTRQLYRTVVAETCRSCHISHQALTFGTLEQFSALKNLIHDDLCRTYTMPNAEQTLDIFWRGSVRPQLLNRLPIQFGCQFRPPPRRAPAPVAASEGGSRPASAVFQGYKTESCACTTTDCLEAVEEKYLPRFVTLGPGEPSEREAIDRLRSEAVDCRLGILAASAAAGQ